MAPVPRSLRVLHVYKDYPPVLGGIEKHLYTLAHYQAHQGLDVTVLVTNPAPFPRSLHTHTHRDTPAWFPAPGPHTPAAAPPRVIRASRLFTVASTPISPAQALWQARLRADIVHLHFPYPPGEVANFLWGRGRATVITYHSDVVRQRHILRVYRPLLMRILRRADAIIATTEAYARTSPFLRANADRVHVIPLGIHLAPFLETTRDAGASLRRALTGSTTTPLVLFVGRLRYYKGVDVLLQALTTLPQVHACIVGEGPMAATWRAQAQALGLGRRVHFVGDVPEEALPRYYAAADLFVLPATSRAEAMGLVLVEAMAAGLPVISTELGTGTSVVNRHGETGFVVPPGDAHALAKAIHTLVTDASLREGMGRAAREHARREFSADVMAERILHLYERVLAQSRT